MGSDRQRPAGGEHEPTRPRRVGVHFDTQYRGKGVEGSGTVLNISHSGALIEPAEPLLISGGEIRLRFSFLESSVPIEIRARVVRETDHGFAVQFVDLTPRIAAVLKLAISRSIEDDGSDDSTLLKIS